MEIGKRLKEKRQEANLTQKELAEILHVSRQTISSWEVGRTYPDLDVLVAISELYNTPLDDLLKEDSKMVKDITEKVQKSQRRKITNIVLAVALLILSITGISYGMQQYQNNQTNEAGLSPSDLLDTTWQVNYDPTGDIQQSILSFANNDMVVFNRYNDISATLSPGTDAEIVEKFYKEWEEKGLSDGVNTYEDLAVTVEVETYIVTAYGYSQEFKRLSDTLIRDSNGIEYYQVTDTETHEDLYYIAEELEIQNN